MEITGIAPGRYFTQPCLAFGPLYAVFTFHW